MRSSEELGTDAVPPVSQEAGDHELSNGTEVEWFMRFGGPFPWCGTYKGRPMALIPLAEYQRLQSIARKYSDEISPSRNIGVRRLRLSKLDQDPEVAKFIEGLLGTAQQSDILKEAIERFGPQRAPSKAALSRFTVRWMLRGRDSATDKA